MILHCSRKPSFILQLTSALYVHRSDTLWREPEVLAWLNATVRDAAKVFESDSKSKAIEAGLSAWNQQIYPNGGVPEGILRHVLVSDVTQLRAFLPPNVLASGLANAYDPLPPRDGNSYDAQYFAATVGSRADSRQQAATNDARQSELQGLFQRMMQYLQTAQGPDGEALDPDTEAAIIAQLEQFGGMNGAAAIGHTEDGLPGGFPNGDDNEASEDDADEDDAEDSIDADLDIEVAEAPADDESQRTRDATQPARGLGGLLRGFWRGNTQTEQTEQG